MVHEPGSASATEGQLARYQAAFEAIREGVALFDSELRLTASNRQFADIYRISPNQLQPGTTLREIAERSAAAGTCPMAADDYIAYTESKIAMREESDWVVALDEVRSIRIGFRPMADGGWISTHEAIADPQETRLQIKEKVSLQSLINLVPDNLWVKDAESRFIVANLATALRMGRSSPKELIGKSDLELCPWETAQKYLADERNVIETGLPMIDSEEYVLSSGDEKLWIATTKVPLRDENGQIVGVVGISRDVTRRRLTDALREGQAEILQLVVGGAPLETILEELVHLVESQSTGIVASIMLLADDSGQPRAGATSLSAIQDRRADLLFGPLGEAIRGGDLVVVPDIGADQAWVDQWAFFSALHLHACWSTPLYSRAGKPLGSLAIFARSAREPTEAELKLMQVAGQLAAIAIERDSAKTIA